MNLTFFLYFEDEITFTQFAPFLGYLCYLCSQLQDRSDLRILSTSLELNTFVKLVLCNKSSSTARVSTLVFTINSLFDLKTGSYLYGRVAKLWVTMCCSLHAP